MVASAGPALTVPLLAVALLTREANAADADDPVQWRVENDDKVIGNEPYELHNTRRRTLNLTSQLGAVWRNNCTFPCISAPDVFDLNWHGSSGGHFVFVRHDKNDRSSISTSEVVAIYNTKTKRYLSNSNRNNGKPEGLLPASAPRFEWVLHGRRGPDFALYNTQVGGYLMLGPKDATLVFANCSGGHNPKTSPTVRCNGNWQATSGGAAPTPAPTAPTVPGQAAVIRTGAGLCLDVHAPDIAKDGARVQALRCHGQPQQLWAYDKLARAIRVSSGLCLDVHLPEVTTNGGRVQVWACHGQPNQQWTVAADGTLRNGGGLCLDVHEPDQFKDGARVQVWACHGARQQRFFSTAF